tara:strand:- start:1635 stop:5921 length:4287 start_codon:yes stop_codon:yes gene_type:complete
MTNNVFDITSPEYVEPTPSTLFHTVETPRDRSMRELSLEYAFRPNMDIGFGGKIYNAFANETVIGEVLRELSAPNYRDTGYVVTKEDIEKYAGDIDPAAAARAAASSNSFGEFLYETDEIRLTEKRRKELYSGGALGFTTGLGLTVLAAGGEAVALSILAGAVGGPAGAAAGAGNAINRMTRIKGMLKGMGLAAAIDVPLETTRYALDKTLRPTDLMIALGASAGITGAIGAYKPHLFLPELQKASDVATKRAAASALREAGDEEAAEAIEKTISMSVRVVDPEDGLEDLIDLKGAELFAEARRLGVQTHRVNDKGRKVFRTQDDIRKDILVARAPESEVPIVSEKKALFAMAKEKGVETTRVTESGRKVPRKAQDVRDDLIEIARKEKKTATPEQVRKQALRDTEGLGRKALVRMAKKIGARSTGSAETIRASIVATRVNIAKTGKKTSLDVPKKLPKGLKKTVSHKGGKIQLKGSFEKLLWKLGTTKDKGSDVASEIRRILKERGFEDPDAIAKDFVKKARAAKKTEGKVFVADAEKMDLPGARLELEDGTVVTGFTRQTEMETKVDSDILGEDADRVITLNGKPIAEGPAEYVDEVAYMETQDPGFMTITGHNQGTRETIARIIETFPADVAGLKWLYNIFAPVTVRFLRSKSSDVRKFAQEFLENPRSATSNVTTRARIAYENHYGTLRQSINAARKEAHEAGSKLTDLEILRAVRSGEEFDGPLGTAVNAVRKYHRDVKAYGAKRGLALDSIPDDGRYVTRSYNHSAFTKIINDLGENGREEVEEVFTQAILKHSDAEEMGVTEAKARAAAKRIVDWGSNPRQVLDVKETRTRLDVIRKELIDDGIPEEEVDSFMELIVPKLDTEPHLSVAKRRIALDENFSVTVNGKTLHIDEFFNNNLLELTGRYGQRVIGGAEIRVGLQNAYGNPDMTRADLLSRLTRSEGVDAGEAKFVERAVDHAYKGLAGMPLYGNREGMKWIMGAQAFGQATIGMTLGFAQIPEIAAIVMRTGVRASFQQLPSLKEIGNIFTMGIRDIATGRQGLGLEALRKMKDDLSSVLETWTGVGGDYARGDHFMRRLDDMGFDSEYLSKGAMRYLEYGRQVSLLNPLGIMPMDTFLRRWAVRSSFQHFVNQAYEVGADGVVTLNKGYWKNSETHFKQLGMSAEDIARLSKAIKDPGVITTRPGMFGKYTVKDMDLTKVKDKEIFDKFAIALRRHSDGMVQRQSFGETPMWMSTPLGKLLGQYRVFMMASKSKQLAAGIARGDAHEAANVVGAIGLGSLAYYMQTYYRSASMESGDRQAYLEKRLSSDYILRAGIMKSSYSTIFPMLIDSASYTLGGEPIFDPSMRTTGLGIDPLRGSVPYSILYNRLLPAGRELTGAAFRGDELSKQDFRNAQGLLWFAKMPGVDQMINRLFINQLNVPEKD